MSEPEEEENFFFYGKPLEPYDEDSFPKKKPIALEDQIATDQQGRRRFHGAFTGGFSAGFFNTVGSLEGWTPSEFKSTRQDKASNRIQKPEDFMDDEDIGQFGIAPQTVRTTSDYASKKRKKQVFSEGPIPGEPLLHSLLSSGNETIGYLLLKNIGFKDKSRTHQEEEFSEQKVYGCEMPKNYTITRHEEIIQFPIPDIYKEFLVKPKDNSFGLGYEGLDKSHISLFKPSNLVVNEKNKKKLSISGQAFGVGAFEDDDEDIYVKDDMNRYDFELTSEKSSKKETAIDNQNIILGEFVKSTNVLPPKAVFLPPTIPQSFIGKHKVKKSRFEPLPLQPAEVLPSRKEMNPEIRAQYLGEEITIPTSFESTQSKEIKKEPDDDSLKESEKKKSSYDNISLTGLIFDRFVSASKPEDPSNILEVVEKSQTTHGTQEMRDAAALKMFGPLTRLTTDWQPCSLLCKRFNVPEPHLDVTLKVRKRTKNLIFEYQKFNEDLPDLQPGLTKQNTIEATDDSLTTQANNVSTSKQSTITDEKNLMENKGEIATTSTTENVTKEVEIPPPKDISDKINIIENVDLFQAIFLSSSESEDDEKKSEEEAKELENKTEAMKVNILSDNLLPKIKPMKEGILSNMNFAIFNSGPSSDSMSKDTSQTLEVTESTSNSYGPKLPESLPYIKNKLSNKLKDIKSDESADEWVEKGQEKERSHHKKKNKKHKKKHKHHKEKSNK